MEITDIFFFPLITCKTIDTVVRKSPIWPIILRTYFTIKEILVQSVYQPDIQDTAHCRAQEGQLKSQQFHVESQSFCHVHHTTDF